VTFDQKVRVIAVRHRFVAAVGTVLVVLGMRPAIVFWGAVGGVRAVDRQNMLFDAAGRWVVQVPVMQKVDMAFVLHGLVAAIGAVLMVVVFVLMVHFRRPFCEKIYIVPGEWRD